MNAQTTVIQHGVFMNIFGAGVLLTGESGVGKSELALALLDRGHQLIADDIVEFSVQEEHIIGCAPKELKNLLEIRGLGIFNVKDIFGDTAILRQHILSLIIHIQKVGFISREISPMKLHQAIHGRMVLRIILPFITERRYELILETLVRNFQLQPQHSLT